MRVFLNILFWSFTSSLFLGLYLKEKFTNDISEILIGFSVLALSFFYLPLDRIEFHFLSNNLLNLADKIKSTYL